MINMIQRIRDRETDIQSVIQNLILPHIQTLLQTMFDYVIACLSVIIAK